MEATFIQGPKIDLFRDEHNNLCARIAGEGEWENVTAKRAFPYSDPRHYVVLEHEGDEIGIVEDVEALDEGSRDVLRDALRKRYHIPDIRRILAVEDAHNAVRWKVDTSAGPRDLLVRGRHNFRKLRSGDLVIIDVDGNRFRIPSGQDLDKQSQRLLDEHA